MRRPLLGITFDAYGTLLHLESPFELLRQQLIGYGLDAPIHVVTEAFLREMVYYRLNHMKGGDAVNLLDLRLRCAEVLFDALSEMGYPCRLNPYERLRILMDSIRFRLFADVAPVLSWCAASGLRTAVISNWDCTLPAILRELCPSHRFKAVMVSAIEGVDKSGPELFLKAGKLLELPASSILHVGDDPDHDLESAMEAGFQAALIDREGKRGSDGPGILRSLAEISSGALSLLDA